jgi:SpoVK/Ycf46/Vps4 family AAA+-type ATPase
VCCLCFFWGVVQLMAMEMFNADGDGVDAAAGGDISAPDAPPMPFMGPKGPKSYSSFQKDKLNLAGLLNVLDGVVDTPGRILVMTTNHPEKLDPALIRPGRINKRLHLGYCSAETVAQMAKHYLQIPRGMSPTQMTLCSEICDRQHVTPAWVEQCCAEVEDLDELLERLKRST